MSSYNLSMVQQLLENNKFEELNNVLVWIVNNDNHTFKDLEILKCFLDSDKISIESKQKIKYLYLKIKKEIEEKIFSGNLQTKKESSVENIALKPSTSIESDSAFVNFKTVILVVFLTIAVVVAVSFLTLRG